MIGNLIKCWYERLFRISREKVVKYRSDLLLEMLPITKDNVVWVRTLRGQEYEKQFVDQLAMGDFGYYACLDGKAVGYGWVKHPGSKDYFFDIEEGCRYLCRFFVHESMRGHGIYPELICALIEHETEADVFHIAVERGNMASEQGLKKVGFEFQKEFSFLRLFRRTVNKYKLKSQGECEINE